MPKTWNLRRARSPKLVWALRFNWWSDRTAGTVVKVSPSGKTVEIQEDRVTEWKDYHGVNFETNPNGRIFVARLRNGKWKTAGQGVTLGSRAAYTDLSF